MENTSWQVLSTCSPHDCETESVAILWSEKIKTLAGQRARTEFYH
ncbi:Ivy family c-type lysozyme inhibitor [Citrobacter freundii]|nr:Ivy family c-type lysozyme inhibitor [Citrobacter freundii]